MFTVYCFLSACRYCFVQDGEQTGSNI